MPRIDPFAGLSSARRLNASDAGIWTPRAEGAVTHSVCNSCKNSGARGGMDPVRGSGAAPSVRALHGWSRPV